MIEIKITLDDGKKIGMIKELKHIFDSDLKETKEFVELLLANMGDTETLPLSIYGDIDKHEAIDKISRSRYYSIVYDFPSEIKSLIVAAVYAGEFQIAKSLIEVIE